MNCRNIISCNFLSFCWIEARETHHFKHVLLFVSFAFQILFSYLRSVHQKFGDCIWLLIPLPAFQVTIIILYTKNMIYLDLDRLLGGDWDVLRRLSSLLSTGDRLRRLGCTWGGDLRLSTGDIRRLSGGLRRLRGDRDLRLSLSRLSSLLISLRSSLGPLSFLSSGLSPEASWSLTRPIWPRMFHADWRIERERTKTNAEEGPSPHVTSKYLTHWIAFI